MPRTNTFTIHPSISVDRPALAGGVIATAADLGAELCDLTTRSGVHREPPGDFVLPGLTLPPLGGSERLGIAVVDAAGIIAVERRPDGSCAVTASGRNRSAAEAHAAARAFGIGLFRQLVLRRIVTLFRMRGFSIVQRCAGGNGAVTLRTRLPLPHQMQPSARTAPPEFAVEVDTDGCVTLHLAGLHRHGRQFVEDTMIRALCETAPTEMIAGSRAKVHAA